MRERCPTILQLKQQEELIGLHRIARSPRLSSFTKSLLFVLLSPNINKPASSPASDIWRVFTNVLLTHLAQIVLANVMDDAHHVVEPVVKKCTLHFILIKH